MVYKFENYCLLECNAIQSGRCSSCFRGKWCLHLQVYSYTLKMEAPHPSETLVTTTRWCNVTTQRTVIFNTIRTSDIGSVVSKCKAIPVTRPGVPQGCEMSRLPNFTDNQLTDIMNLLALCTGHHLPPGRFLALISVRDWVHPRATVQLEGLGQLISKCDKQKLTGHCCHL
jgi:hypothetical protein